MTHTIDPGDPGEADVAALLAASESLAYALYPPQSVHMLDVAELTRPSVRFLVARSAEGTAEGCGAVVLEDDGTAELKRMFVTPSARGRGLGASLLGRLEDEARRAGVGVIRLETGVQQPEAIGLYRRFGYVDRGPFGRYAEDPLSVFMEKRLALSP